MSKTSKGGRPAIGDLRWRLNPKATPPRMQWMVRCTNPGDSTRTPFIELPPNIPQEDRAGARAAAKVVSDITRAGGTVSETVGETTADWFKKLHEHKAARGLSTVKDMVGRARKWILPGIADKDIRGVTLEDIEAIVRRLDRAAEAFAAQGPGKGRL